MNACDEETVKQYLLKYRSHIGRVSRRERLIRISNEYLEEMRSMGCNTIGDTKRKCLETTVLIEKVIAQWQQEKQTAIFQAERIRQQIDNMPGEYADILRWYYLDGITWEKIAEELNLSLRALFRKLSNHVYPDFYSMYTEEINETIERRAIPN